MRPVLRIHIQLVTILGWGVALAVLARGGTSSGFGIEWADQGFWILATLAILGELVPFRVPFRHEAQEVTLSTTFVLAILFMFGLPAAIAIQAAGSLLSDALQRKRSWKAAFNVGQYTLSWTAAALLVGLLNGGDMPQIRSFGVWPLTAVLLAGATFFVVNSTLIGTAIALATDVPVGIYLRRGFGFHASTALVLSSLAPVVIVLTNQHAWLVPLLLLPIAAVHKSARISLDMEHQARHDPLTGLANRIAFQEWITDTLAEDDQIGLDVMIVDLDTFRDVNDTLGHEIGDRLLRLVAQRLTEEFSDATASLARLGADEFAVASEARCSTSGASLIDRITNAL